jgi:hypothetical protein
MLNKHASRRVGYLYIAIRCSDAGCNDTLRLKAVDFLALSLCPTYPATVF